MNKINFKYDYNYNLYSTIVYMAGTIVFLILGIVAKPMLLALFAIGIGKTAASWVGMRNEVEATIDDSCIAWGEGASKITLEWSVVNCQTIQKEKYTSLTINTGYSKHKLFFFEENKAMIDELISKGIVKS
ncbi:MAG: hypothetical protein IKR18_01375 [Bacteroidaceae bacterium]|nr:hypothetical protein [Bacteroidaceae bacterium]